MKYVSLPDNVVRPLPFYLSMEEYVARRYSEELFFMWQVNPTVIFGRNQLVDSEVNTDYCRRRGIAFYRRKSGGGCVYADMDNIMFSYIVSCDDIVTLFSSYTSRIASMLVSLGVDASSNGRNDVLIGDRKVSGNAFYHIPGRSIVHGTMLYDTDLENMSMAISPSGTKLQSKGVSSVKSRITTLKEHLDIPLDEFKEYVRRYLCDGNIALDDSDVAAIEEMSRPYYTDSWIYGHNPRYTTHLTRRIDGVGEFCTYIELKNGVIKDINISGDFFLVGDLDEGLLARLRGISYDRESLMAALSDVEPGSVIAGLRRNEMIDILM